MSKICLITDTHAGVRNNSTVFHKYCEKYFTDFFFPELEKRDIKTIIHLGDVFDRRKDIDFRTLDVWKTFFFNKLDPYAVHIILGNHDCTFKNTNKLNSVQQLLSQYKNFKIYDSPDILSIDNLNIAMLPWVSNTETQQALDFIKASSQSCNVLFGHLDIVGFQMNGGHINKDVGFNKETFSRYDLVCSGHYHISSLSDNIHYLGSPYAQNWGDAFSKFGFYIFDTDTYQREFIENPYSLFQKVYYDDVKHSQKEIAANILSLKLQDKYVKIIIENKSNPVFYDKILGAINEMNPFDVSIVNLDVSKVSDTYQTDLTKDTLTMLKEHVDQLDFSNKEEIKQTIASLYQEALNLDFE